MHKKCVSEKGLITHFIHSFIHSLHEAFSLIASPLCDLSNMQPRSSYSEFRNDVWFVEKLENELFRDL